ncbi:hypothetical protein, partial [Hominisplanchenecus murintestinalis]|uniref:hypothetical protein n=1 Tax=Hominisplanchenecus murintestinalis TaxID=2941517 RepID=UPI0020419FA6
IGVAGENLCSCRYISIFIPIWFNPLLKLLYELPKSILTQIDDFVDRLYNEFINLPDIEDNVKREIKLSCILDKANTVAINEEIERLYELLC